METGFVVTTKKGSASVGANPFFLSELFVSYFLTIFLVAPFFIFTMFTPCCGAAIRRPLRS